MSTLARKKKQKKGILNRVSSALKLSGKRGGKLRELFIVGGKRKI